MNDRQRLLSERLAEYKEQTGSEICARFDRMLSECSSFHIGGPAECALYPSNAEQLRVALDAAQYAGMPVFAAGNASNVLFDDEGYRGAVIFTSAMHNTSADSESCTVTADAGAMLSGVAACAQRAGIAGLEYLHGIPGTLGGGIYMNCGAFGGQISENLVSCTYLDTKSGAVVTETPDKLGFAYRSSIFMQGGRIILGAVLRGEAGERDSIKQQMEEHMAYRFGTQPLDFPSAGSVFKRYPGYYTSRLIEEAGLKGRAVGGAEVSLKHAGFIINRGGATAADVRELIDIIKDEIFRANGIHIECEIIFAPKA